MTNIHEPRFVLTRVYHDSEARGMGMWQEDDYDDALTEQQMLEMLARKLGYKLTKD